MRFFRWGATISLVAQDEKYSLQAIKEALMEKKAIKSAANLDTVLEKLTISNSDQLTEHDTKAVLRYYGYYLNEQADYEKKGSQWETLSWLQKGMYWTGGVVGCCGAAFKGALAFAGTVVFCLLITAGTLAVTATPAGWIIGLSLLVGLTTWMVQCSRACPNTANGFLSWCLKSSTQMFLTSSTSHENRVSAKDFNPQVSPTNTSRDTEHCLKEEASKVNSVSANNFNSQVSPTDTSLNSFLNSRGAKEFSGFSPEEIKKIQQDTEASGSPENYLSDDASTVSQKL